MSHFHNHFKATWSILYGACEKSELPHGMSRTQFISTASQFLRQLSFHHAIEEQHIFPILAERMPAFQAPSEGGKAEGRAGVLLQQHREIHAGMDELEGFLKECKSGARDLSFEEMKRVMDTFGDVLWRHLDLEVDCLSAEEMRRWWNLEEVRGLPM